MEPSDGIPKSPARWIGLLVWGGFAALSGLGCVALPPHFIPGAMVRPGYGWPLFPWFASAFANLCFLPSFAALFVLGALLGLAQPGGWFLSSCLTVSLPIVFNCINLVFDLTIDS